MGFGPDDFVRRPPGRTTQMDAPGTPFMACRAFQYNFIENQ